jgi:hypothetical protein
MSNNEILKRIIANPAGLHGCSRRSELELNPVQDGIEGNRIQSWNPLATIIRLFCHDQLLDPCSVMVQIV